MSAFLDEAEHELNGKYLHLATLLETLRFSQCANPAQMRKFQ
jgi:hypothetical protein